MIYSTNRTSALGDIAIDVNESYYGVGYMNFLQESAEDELALFEMAIKSDIDEVLIGESSYELEALNENFAEGAVNKIKEMVKKFIEWLHAVTRSAITKLSQLIVRDNIQFIKIAEKQIDKLDKNKFKYEGKGLDFNKVVNMDPKEYKMPDDDKLEDGIATLKALNSNSDTNNNESFIKTFEKKGDEGIKLVKQHITYLSDKAPLNLKNLKKKLKLYESDAKALVKDAERKLKDFKETNDNKDEKKTLNLRAEWCNEYLKYCKKNTSDVLHQIKTTVKIARAVVTKAMGASPKNEGFYTEELLDAMIETANYEYDEALEEMSAAKDGDLEDDMDDDEE